MKKPTTPSRESKTAQLFRDAAKLKEAELEEDKYSHGSCWHLSAAAGWGADRTMLLDRFQALFAPEGYSCGSFWWGWTEDEDNARVVALCFMAAIVEAGDA